MEVEFFKCRKCGKIITIVNKTGVPTICCGEEMQKLIPGTTEASTEKHIPVVTINGNSVDVVVGSVIHPMEEKHHIEWIALQTSNGLQIKYLNPQNEPKASFVLTENEKVEKVYAHCNLHGLWASN